MAHLFIISDEFAELKSQQPEFLAELVSTARIGRSLGVHLILATQKPSGVVTANMYANYYSSKQEQQNALDGIKNTQITFAEFDKEEEEYESF